MCIDAHGYPPIDFHLYHSFTLLIPFFFPRKSYCKRERARNVESGISRNGICSLSLFHPWCQHSWKCVSRKVQKEKRGRDRERKGEEEKNGNSQLEEEEKLVRSGWVVSQNWKEVTRRRRRRKERRRKEGNKDELDGGMKEGEKKTWTKTVTFKKEKVFLRRQGITCLWKIPFPSRNSSLPKVTEVVCSGQPFVIKMWFETRMKKQFNIQRENWIQIENGCVSFVVDSKLIAIAKLLLFVFTKCFINYHF